MEENPELMRGAKKTARYAVYAVQPTYCRERTVHVLYDLSSQNAKTLVELLKAQMVPGWSNPNVRLVNFYKTLQHSNFKPIC
jgi:hypothetical protein